MVISIIALLIAIITPTLSKARIAAKNVLNANNQRQIVIGANNYSTDNDGRYPQSVAINRHRTSANWNWHDPRKLVASASLSENGNRSVSGMLKSYVEAGTIYCPGSPSPKHKYWDLMWEMGDDYDCPTIAGPDDQFFGTYCLYWNYTGSVAQSKTGVFYGPSRNDGRKDQSDMLISDYLGYGHWNFDVTDSYGSCEKFLRSSRARETDYLSSCWLSKNSFPDVKLNAGFMDGSIRSYTPKNTVLMKVFRRNDLSDVYRPGMGPGYFYIPAESLR